MSERYPYPEREHLSSPETLLEMISLQTDVFAASEAAAKEVEYLAKLYGERPLGQGAMYLAGLTRMSVMSNQEFASAHDLENSHTNFFAGAIVAIHTNLYPQSKLKRDWALALDPVGPLKDDNIPERQRGMLIEALASDLCDWHVMNGAHSFESQTSDLKEKIRELSIAVYKDIANPEGQDAIFINGYMFLSELLWGADAAYNSYDRGFLPKV